MTSAPDVRRLDVAVIGAGQAALSIAYSLRRSGLSITGGAWRQAWPSLRLFSPAQWSSLPGWLMPRQSGEARDAYLVLDTSTGVVHARAVVSATGTWANPVAPGVAGQDNFGGVVLHSAHYPGPAPFIGRRVVVVGGGNPGAQIVAELSAVAEVTWATREPPHFLPDEVDGRYLFEQATARYRALQEGRTITAMLAADETATASSQPSTHFTNFSGAS